MLAPASDRGSGNGDDGEAVLMARLEPNRLADIPGARGTCAKLAELTKESTRGTFSARAPCTSSKAPRQCVAATSRPVAAFCDSPSTITFDNPLVNASQ